MPIEEILLSHQTNPRRFVRDTVRFLLEAPGRVAVVSGPTWCRKTEFALPCAYHLGRRQRILFLSAEIYPHVLGERLLTMYGAERAAATDLTFATAFGFSLNRVMAAIADHPSHVVVIDCINLMDIELSDLEKLAKDANISILATRTIAENK